MAGKPKRMSQVKQIFLRHSQGQPIKVIARDLGISKNTVKSYLQKAAFGELNLSTLLELEEPVLEAKLFSGNPSYKDDRYEYLKSRMQHYHKELKQVGVNRKVLWQEYCIGTSNPYSYTQFCYHLQQFRRSVKPTMVMDHQPADKLYIDFAGKKLSYVNRYSGEVIEVEVFVACLPYSDYCFAMAVPRQSTEDFLYGLTCCLKDLGGVPQTLVPDNLKAAVIRANAYEPELNQALEDFANHYGCAVTPARPGKPRDKSLVENQVKLLYSRVYAKLRKQTFFDLASLNHAIAIKVKLHNQTRMQNKAYCREEKFISEEKEHLNSLPGDDFEIKYYREYKVANNNHIRLGIDKHYYSVPFTYIGKQVKVIYTHRLVKIYHQAKLIATHPRNPKKGGYTTCKEHLCSHHQYYKKRSPTYYLQRGYGHSETLYKYFQALFEQDKYPEQLYRTCDGVLHLAKRTAESPFIKACHIAMEHQNYSFQFLKQLLENKMTEYQQDAPQKTLPKHHNIRGAAAYK